MIPSSSHTVHTVFIRSDPVFFQTKHSPTSENGSPTLALPVPSRTLFPVSSRGSPVCGSISSSNGMASAEPEETADEGNAVFGLCLDCVWIDFASQWEVTTSAGRVGVPTCCDTTRHERKQHRTTQNQTEPHRTAVNHTRHPPPPLCINLTQPNVIRSAPIQPGPIQPGPIQPGTIQPGTIPPRHHLGTTFL